MKKIIIIGGRGNGTVIASLIEDINKVEPTYEIIGFLNDNFKTNEKINGYSVLGKINKITCYKYLDCLFVYALISTNKAEERIKMFEELEIPFENMVTLIHPSAVISDQATLGVGVIIMPNVTVSPNATVKEFTQIYANSVIGHDTEIEPFVFIANSSSIGSFIKIGEGAHIGSNATIRERVNIGKYSVIGMGSVVLNDIKSYTVNIGVPSKELS